MSIDFNQIAVFSRVAELGSFTKAAAALKQPKSRISRNIAALEASLGTQLLYRTTRQIRLTPAGEEYFQKVHGLVAGLEAATQDVSSGAGDLSGLIRVTAPEDVGALLLGPVLDRFLKENPAITLDVRLTSGVLDLVGDSIDLAIRIGRLKDTSLKARRMGNITSILVASPAYLKIHGVPDDVSQLARHRCLHFAYANHAPTWRLQGPSGNVDLRVAPFLAMNHAAALRDMVVAGHGISLLPDFLCQPALRQGHLVHILKPWNDGAVPVHLVTPHAKGMPARVKRLGDAIYRELSVLFA